MVQRERGHFGFVRSKKSWPCVSEMFCFAQRETDRGFLLSCIRAWRELSQKIPGFVFEFLRSQHLGEKEFDAKSYSATVQAQNVDAT